jgi:rSAM/selenodomain-associated transferase 2
MKVSVILPTLDEAENIIPSILSINSQGGEFELIVVDGGSTDGTVEIVQPHATIISSERGRALQMNEGARHASGEVLLFLHSDSILPVGALAALRQTLQDPRNAGGTFTLRFDSDQLPLRFYAFLTRFKFRYFHYGDQGIFVRRSVFEKLGGFREMPLMEDADFLRRLSQAGRRTLIQLPVTTSARRFLKYGVVLQELLNILLVFCYLLGVKPETLSKWYPVKVTHDC